MVSFRNLITVQQILSYMAVGKQYYIEKGRITGLATIVLIRHRSQESNIKNLIVPRSRQGIRGDGFQETLYTTSPLIEWHGRTI